MHPEQRRQQRARRSGAELREPRVEIRAQFHRQPQHQNGALETLQRIRDGRDVRA